MKFSGSIIINKPRKVVTQLFADPENLKEYQDGFVSKELISGKQGQDGAIAKMYFKHGTRDMELIETITANKLPYSFESHYHHKHMDNTMKCVFTEVDRYKTKYEYHIAYTRVSWVLPKLLSILFPGMFKKQVDKWMRQFKEFVEKQ